MEDVICVLKTEKTRKTLESHYGSAAPTTALQALQRDSLLTNTQTHIDNVYQRPMAEVSHQQYWQILITLQTNNIHWL